MKERDREREREIRGGAAREGDTGSEAAVSTEPDAGLELGTGEVTTGAGV